MMNDLGVLPLMFETTSVSNGIDQHPHDKKYVPCYSGVSILIIYAGRSNGCATSSSRWSTQCEPRSVYSDAGWSSKPSTFYD